MTHTTLDAEPTREHVRVSSRAERHAATRRSLARRAVAGTAGLGLAAAALLLIAIPDAGKKPDVKLPSGQAAAAAFTEGLKAAPASTLMPAALAKPAVAKPAVAKPAVAKPAGAKPAAAKPAVAKPAAAKSTVTVAIKNYAFSPASLSIKAGTKVTWTNMDTAPHTVTVSSGPVKFASPTLQKGDSYTYTFTTAGTYSYYCAVHPEMTAKVVVTPSSAPPTSTPPTTAAPSSPAPSTSTMTMPPPSSGDSSCAASTALQTFLTHINSAHLDESPGQQVQDILDLDRYIGNHLVLVKTMLEPLTGGGLTNALSGLLQTLLTHVNAAHLDESPGQQVQDILNINSYIGNHLVLVQRMLANSEALAC